ncbi:MAG: MraY family glycosyltransferase [Porphyrobacter sp.]|nr:MraY family glycosyltransferase [Porphyrobacter sp.]
MTYHYVLALFSLSAALTFALCRVAAPLGQWLGVIDTPSASGSGGHKRHADPTPAVGGVILAIVGVTLSLALLPYTKDIAPHLFNTRLLASAAVVGAMVIGFVDDRAHLRPSVRLLLAAIFAVALLLLVPQYRIERVEFPSIGVTLDTGIWALPFTAICLVALKNAINMADGRNGLILGLSLIWITFFLLHATPAIFPVLVVVSAALLVLFAFNVRGKLFMGDCGAYGIATLFGICALSLHNQNYGTIRTAEVVLLFLMPVLDTLRLILVRLLSGQSPLAPDGRHLHHLLDEAIGWRRGWAVYMVLAAAPIMAYQLIDGYGVHIISVATLAYAIVVLALSARIRELIQATHVDTPAE